MVRIFATTALASVACLTHAQGTSDRLDEAAIERDIESALINRVDDAKNTVGIIVGVASQDRRLYLTNGTSDSQTDATITEETIFEIGSLTKVFTSLLLADMAESGEVDLNDPIGKYLPPDLITPSFDGTHITLVDLATHTSGLPFRSATSLESRSDLYDYLTTYELDVKPGAHYQYSNLGFGLLGNILALRSGKSFEELLKERVLDPLGMSSTTISLSGPQQDRMATGHNAVRDPIGLTNVRLHAGAGALRSTASDMLRFAEAWLGLVDHSLEPAMNRMLWISRPMPREDRDTHLGWIGIENKTLFHIGQTRGFASALAVRPDIQRAVIVLSNSPHRVDTIALHGVMPERSITVFEVAGKLKNAELAD